uniref:Uncharacterized protein n=1 Tax=Cannabis sativa TaxID=3483 RepID=A0A803Q0L6_CANSA
MDELPFRHIGGKGFQKLIRLFFDDFQFPSRIINFIQVPSHKGELVGKELINCLNEWGISKVFVVTVDNASSNDVALRKLKGHLLEKDNTVPLNGEMFHMRCSAHTLNLIVSDGLKELNEAISSIRNAVRYVRSSPVRLKRFKESCTDANIESKALLCLDVVTRWNSTYMMLEAAIKFKKAFYSLEGDVNYTRYFDEERMTDPPNLCTIPSEADKMIKMVTNILAQLYAFYKQQQTTQPFEAQQSQAPPSQSQPQVSQPSKPTISATTESFLLGQLQLCDDVEECDLKYYLNDRHEKLDPAFDILQWWKQN